MISYFVRGEREKQINNTTTTVLQFIYSQVYDIQLESSWTFKHKGARICPGMHVVPHSRRNSLSNQLFLLCMSQLWPSLGLWTLSITSVRVDIQSKAKCDNWENFWACAFFLELQMM